MPVTHNVRNRQTAHVAFAALAGTLAVWLGGCAPSPAVTGAQGKSSAPLASQSSPPTALPVAATATATLPASAAKPAPTPGGVPPTIVGRTQPTTPAVSSQPPSGTPTPQPAVRVTLTANRTFDPPQITINTGDTVQWVNVGRAPQTVTGDPAKVQNKADAQLPPDAKPWNSGTLNTGQTFAHRFDVPGDYTYTSLPAEGQGLVGRITVQ